jgi:hypothetical protein
MEGHMRKDKSDKAGLRRAAPESMGAAVTLSATLRRNVSANVMTAAAASNGIQTMKSNARGRGWTRAVPDEKAMVKRRSVGDKGLHHLPRVCQHDGLNARG